MGGSGGDIILLPYYITLPIHICGLHVLPVIAGILGQHIKVFWNLNSKEDVEVVGQRLLGKKA